MLTERTEDGIVIATFEKERTNSIDMEVLRALRDIVARVNSDDSLKGIILTGSGKLFSSGFDLPMFLGFPNVEEVTAFIQEEDEILTDLFMCRKPVVSAMNGSTIAAGLIFSMAADYRIVTNHPKIKINMSEIKLGLPLSIAQSEIMRFGLESNKLFRDVMYFGKMFDVTAALELGIVDEVVEGDELIDRAKKIITGWIDNPGRAFMKLKEGVRKPIANRIGERLAGENWQESLTCFFEKDVRTTLEFVQQMM